MVNLRKQPVVNVDVTTLEQTLRDANLTEEQADYVLQELTKPPLLLTLEEASAEYCVPINTLYTWIRRGQLEVREREKGFVRGGGIIKVAATDVALLKLRKSQKTG